jgi:hypothetical protein
MEGGAFDFDCGKGSHEEWMLSIVRFFIRVEQTEKPTISSILSSILGSLEMRRVMSYSQEKCRPHDPPAAKAAVY